MVDRLIEARCTHCNQAFELSYRLAGSLQNCPSCQRATQIEGSHDPLWTVVSVGARLIVFLAVGIVYSLHGLGPGLAALAAGVAVLLLVRLCL